MLTSPWPESLYTFMHVWPRLSTLASVLPGFGRSQRRTDLLSPLAMSPFTVGLLDSWEIGEPHLVSADVGTSAARLAAANDACRFRSLVVGIGASAIRISYVGLSLPAIVAGVASVRTGSLERRGLVRIEAGHQDQRERVRVLHLTATGDSDLTPFPVGRIAR